MGAYDSAGLRNVLVLPEHSRDEKHLLEAVASLEEDSNFRVIIVYRRAVSVFRARLRNAWQKLESPVVYWEWPSTNHGTNLDGGVGLEAQTLRRQLRKKFGCFEFIFVSDIVGDQPALAVEFQRAEGTSVVLVPEGLSVLSNNSSSRWIERNWKSAAGLIFRDTWRELGDLVGAKLWKGRQRRWRRKLRLGWRFRRIARLLASRPHDSFHWRLVHVDSVLSDWPAFVEIPVESQHFLVRSRWQLDMKARGPCKQTSAVIIGQPLDISISTWSLGLKTMKHNVSQIDRVVLRPHPDREFEEQLMTAIREVFTDAQVEVSDPRTEVESLLISENFGYICAASSTVLFDELVWRRTDSNLVCLYDVLYECASPAERRLLEKQMPAVRCIRDYSHLGGVALLERRL